MLHRRSSPKAAGPLSEQQELLHSLQETQRSLHHAHLAFDDAVDPELVEACIYEIRALQSRINYLLRRLKAEEERLRALPAGAGEEARWL